MIYEIIISKEKEKKVYKVISVNSVESTAFANHEKYSWLEKLENSCFRVRLNTENVLISYMDQLESFQTINMI